MQIRSFLWQWNSNTTKEVTLFLPLLGLLPKRSRGKRFDLSLLARTPPSEQAHNDWWTVVCGRQHRNLVEYPLVVCFCEVKKKKMQIFWRRNSHRFLENVLEAESLFCGCMARMEASQGILQFRFVCFSTSFSTVRGTNFTERLRGRCSCSLRT